MIKYCICGHSESHHFFSEGWGKGKCAYTSCHFHEFKLDHLKFIEDLAKERKLV